jgi:hypothetical protein
MGTGLMSFGDSEWRSHRVDLLRFVRRRVNDAAMGRPPDGRSTV